MDNNSKTTTTICDSSGDVEDCGGSNNNNNNNNRISNTTICMLQQRRYGLLLFSLISVSLTAGIVYGWPALRRQLQQDDSSSLTETQLGAIYTAGSWSAQGGRFVTGTARDKYGTRAVACGSLVCTLIGAVGIALVDASDGIALGVSIFIMSLGSGVQLVVQPVGSLFPGTSNAVISSLSGAFQISGLVFLVLTSMNLPRQPAFLGYAVLVAVLTVLAWFMLPASRSFHLLGDEEEEASATTNNIKSSDEENEETIPSSITGQDASSRDDHANNDNTPRRNTIQVPREEWGSNNDNKTATNAMISKQEECDTFRSHRPTKLQQIVSYEYIGLLTWFSICLVPMQYYVGSIGLQLERRGDIDGFYTDLFSIIYASSAIVSPAGGYMADRLGLGLTQGVSTVIMAMCFFVLGFSEIIPLSVQSVGLVCYGVGRMLIFGMFFANIGARFGFTNYGTLSGIGLLVSAFASLLQYPLLAAAASSQASASVVNFSSGAVLLGLTPYCVWLAWTERHVNTAQTLLSIQG